MPSLRSSLGTLGELGHAAEFWNKLFRSPGKFFKEDLLDNPLGIFSMATPFVSGGGAAILAMALLSLAGIPSCMQNKNKKPLNQEASIERVASPVLPASAIARTDIHEPQTPPKQAVAFQRWPTARTELLTTHTHRRNGYFWIVGPTPLLYYSFFDQRRLPNRKALNAFAQSEKCLMRMRNINDLHAALPLGHDVQGVE